MDREGCPRRHGGKETGLAPPCVTVHPLDANTSLRVPLSIKIAEEKIGSLFIHRKRNVKAGYSSLPSLITTSSFPHLIIMHALLSLAVLPHVLLFLRPTIACHVNSSCPAASAELIRSGTLHAINMASDALDALSKTPRDENVNLIIELLFCRNGEDPNTIDLSKVTKALRMVQQLRPCVEG